MVNKIKGEDKGRIFAWRHNRIIAFFKSNECRLGRLNQEPHALHCSHGYIGRGTSKNKNSFSSYNALTSSCGDFPLSVSVHKWTQGNVNTDLSGLSLFHGILQCGQLGGGRWVPRVLRESVGPRPNPELPTCVLPWLSGQNTAQHQHRWKPQRQHHLPHLPTRNLY